MKPTNKFGNRPKTLLGRGRVTQRPSSRGSSLRRNKSLARQGWTPCRVEPSIVFEDLLPDLKEANSGFAWACCPFHNDNNPSLCVNLISGWYRCASSSCGATGSNIVGFVGRLLALESHEARRYVESHYG